MLAKRSKEHSKCKSSGNGNAALTRGLDITEKQLKIHIVTVINSKHEQLFFIQAFIYCLLCSAIQDIKQMHATQIWPLFVLQLLLKNISVIWYAVLSHWACINILEKRDGSWLRSNFMVPRAEPVILFYVHSLPNTMEPQSRAVTPMLYDANNQSFNIPRPLQDF